MFISFWALMAKEMGGLFTSNVSNHSCDLFYGLIGLNSPDFQKCHFPLRKFSLSWLNTHTHTMSSFLSINHLLL